MIQPTPFAIGYTRSRHEQELRKRREEEEKRREEALDRLLAQAARTRAQQRRKECPDCRSGKGCFFHDYVCGPGC